MSTNAICFTYRRRVSKRDFAEIGVLPRCIWSGRADTGRQSLMKKGRHMTDPILTISFFNCANDAKPKENRLAWSKFVEQFIDPEVRQSKDGPLFSPALFSPGHRANKNVKAISALTLDYDHDAYFKDEFLFWRQVGF